MELGVWHLTGITLTLLIITGLGVWSGRQVKSAADFTTGGGRAGTLMLTGSMMGALVGGACTIGTAQLAFTNGFSAIWFTAGLSAGCLFLALGFIGPMRRSGRVTLQQVIADEYGPLAGFVTSVVGALSLMLSVISQLLSAVALIGSLFPIPRLAAALIGMALVLCYVLFGGLLSAGRIGTVKTVLIYAATAGGGLLALRLAGGPGALFRALPPSGSFGLFSRGLAVDGGAGLSSILGFLSTQTYVQCVLSGKSDAVAVRGTLISALLIPPIGVGSVLVGLYMRIHSPGVSPAQAFPLFVLQTMPPLVAGIVLATLLIAILGATAGLMLGVGTIISTDLYARAVPAADDERRLLVSRLSIVAALGLSLVFVCTLEGAILHWSFLSMGLRSTLTFFPLLGALFLPGRFDRRFMLASILVGPTVVLLSSALPGLPCDPLFPGMAAALIPLALGCRPPRETL